MSTYVVNWTSGASSTIPGKATISIPDDTTVINKTTLSLTGRDVVAYGQIQQTNFIQLLESFANLTSPNLPTVGQLWYNPTNTTLYVCVYPNITPAIAQPTITSINGSSSGSDNSWWAPVSLNYVALPETGGSMTGSIAFANSTGVTVTGLPSPQHPGDAATKAYVDAATSSLNVHASVVTTTSANLSALYVNGTTDTNGGLGTGATLTASAAGILTLSGVSPSIGQRVLIKDQTSQFENGVYVVTQPGSAFAAWVLTRASDYDDSVAENPPQVNSGDYVYVSSGSQVGTGWIQQGRGTGTNSTILIGTDPITYTLLTTITAYSAGTGLSLTGQTFTNTGVLSLTAGTNISVTGTGGNLTIALSGAVPNAVNAAVAATVNMNAYSGASTLPVTFSNMANQYYNNNFTYNATSGVLTVPNVSGSLLGNATTATNASTATNIAGGGTGYLPYQSASGVTAFLSPGASGQVLTLSGGVPTWQNPSGGGGSVTSITGTANQIIASAATGPVTLSLPQSIGTTSSPTFASATLGGALYHSPTSYGAAAVSGANGGYAGIQFSGASGTMTLMVASGSAISGIYALSAPTGGSAGWQWYFTGSTLTVGTVPAANIGAGTAAISISGNAATATTAASATTASTATTQATGTNNTTIATTAFVQSQIAATGAVSPCFWTYSNPAAITNTNGYINWQTATTGPVGIDAYSAGKITIDIPGYYFITVSAVVTCDLETSNIGEGQIALYHNGALVGTNIVGDWENQTVYNNAFQSNIITISAIVHCALLDTLQVYYTSSGYGSLASGQGSFTGFKMA
jgi:hypothetical protein